jgi:hypothetical protein
MRNDEMIGASETKLHFRALDTRDMEHQELIATGTPKSEITKALYG